MKSLLDRFFRRFPKEDRTWTETICVEEPSTPVTRYVNCILIQMSETDSQTKIFKRNEKLPPLTIASHTVEPPLLDAIVERLKIMCNIKLESHTTPLDGMIPCTIRGVSFDVKCHFDDTAESCCWIRVEKSDEIRDFSTPDEIQKDRSRSGGQYMIPCDSQNRYVYRKKHFWGQEQELVFKADKKTCKLIIAGYIVAVVILILLMMYIVPRGEKQIEDVEPETLLRVIQIIIGFIFLSIIPFGVCLFRFGWLAVLQRRIPPTGTKVIMDTKVLEGDKAVTRGWLMMGIALALIALSLIGGLYLPYKITKVFTNQIQPRIPQANQTE